MKLTTIPNEIPAENPRCIAVNAAIAEHAELLHASARALNRAYGEFWQGTIQDVVAFFNELGPEKVAAACNEHNAQALSINALLESAIANDSALAARLPQRATTVPMYYIEGAAIPEGITASIRLVGGVFEEI